MNAVLNVAVGQWFPKGADRLMDSLDRFNEPADYLVWKNRYPKGCPPHHLGNYVFKPYAFKEAREDGYDKAIWMDASCWLVRPLDEAWAHIEEHGYLIGMDGHSVGAWCSSRVREELGRAKEELDEIPLILGGFIGLDLQSNNGFLDNWLDYADRGLFQGSWDQHRHDITCGGIIAHDMGLTLTPHLLEYDHKGPPHPDVYVRAAGM